MSDLCNANLARLHYKNSVLLSHTNNFCSQYIGMPDNINFLFFCVCSVSRACMDVCECVPACVHTWVRRQQVLRLVISTLFKAASLTTQGTHCFSDTSCPACSRDLQDSALPQWGYRHTSPHPDRKSAQVLLRSGHYVHRVKGLTQRAISSAPWFYY